MNLEDVAKLAGVSTSTVSRVLNNLSVVRPTTRARVLRAVEELHFVPNANARALMSGSRTVAMIVSSLQDAKLIDLFEAIDRELKSRGLDLILATTDHDRERVGRTVRTLLGQRIQGLLLATNEVDEQVLVEIAYQKTRSVVFNAERCFPFQTRVLEADWSTVSKERLVTFAVEVADALTVEAEDPTSRTLKI